MTGGDRDGARGASVAPCVGMKKNNKLTVQRHTLKSLATDVLDGIEGGRAPTTGGGTTGTHSVENSRCNSCTYGCPTQLFC
jgi:hypothetical protein